MLCCGLPAVFSVLSLLSAVGIIVSMPVGLEHLHLMTHNYETGMFVFSGCVMVVGWILHYIADRMDCQTQGCCHEPCRPKKKRSATILVVATVLFAVNSIIYFVYHC